MNHKEILTQSAATLRLRSEQFGAEEDVMGRACIIFETITGSEISLYEAAIFMHSYEMSRIKQSRHNLSNVMNGIDYLALSGQFAAAELSSTMDEMEGDIKKMASKLAPIPRTLVSTSLPTLVSAPIVEPGRADEDR